MWLHWSKHQNTAPQDNISGKVYVFFAPLPKGTVAASYSPRLVDVFVCTNTLSLSQPHVNKVRLTSLSLFLSKGFDKFPLYLKPAMIFFPITSHEGTILLSFSTSGFIGLLFFPNSDSVTQRRRQHMRTQHWSLNLLLCVFKKVVHSLFADWSGALPK